MPVIIGLLRGVNIGGHHKIKMDLLRDLCLSLKFQSVKTYLQSGNVVFRTSSRSLAELSKVLEAGIERKAGFRPAVILRTIPEFRAAIANNPFANRAELEPSKLAVAFLAAGPSAPACRELLAMDITPEELRVHGRELYIYFPNGQARPRLSWPRVEKILQCAYTARNWNTVRKLLELAESLDTNG